MHERSVMSAPEICGFVAVRLPEFNEDNFHLRPPPISGKVYRGVDRLRWEIPVGSDEASRSAMKALAKPTREWPFDSVFHPGLTPELRSAQEFVRHGGGVDEVLAVHNDHLAEVCGPFRCGYRLEPLGWELFAAGEWSPHWAGVFWHPAAFPDVTPLLNRHGLFDTEDDTRLLAERYVALMRAEVVEPLADPPDFMTLRLYRVS